MKTKEFSTSTKFCRCCFGKRLRKGEDHASKDNLTRDIANGCNRIAACSAPEQLTETATAPAQAPAPAAPAASSELKRIQQKQSRDYQIALLNETGSLKQGTNNLTLEFRRGDQLTDPGNVQVKPMMEMKGMGPMLANSHVTPSGTPGRYNVTTDLSMPGEWKLMVTFSGGETEFALSTQ